MLPLYARLHVTRYGDCIFNDEFDYLFMNVDMCVKRVNFTSTVPCSVSFDYEEKAEYSFSLIVSDNGRTPRQSEPSSVTIAITNINDEIPEFERANYSECYYIVSNC